MQKGEKTRRHIIEKSAELFNRHGYAGSSLSDIIESTGIQKGGIYRHFDSKDEIALEAYDYATSVVGARIREALDAQHTAQDKLLAFIRVYEHAADAPPFTGGCPLLNTAIETDDGHPELRARARLSLERTLSLLRSIISLGIESGEFRPETDAEALAAFTLSIMEGGVMMSRLTGDNRYMQLNLSSFAAYLKHACLSEPQTDPTRIMGDT